MPCVADKGLGCAEKPAESIKFDVGEIGQAAQPLRTRLPIMEQAGQGQICPSDISAARHPADQRLLIPFASSANRTSSGSSIG
jgi:hypothetical protein